MAAETQTRWEPREGEIKLRDPQFVSLTFGQGHPPEGAIQFGSKGGFAEGEWVGPADHPLLPDLLRKRPDIIVVNDDGPVQVFMCSEHAPAQEFKTRQAYNAHVAKAHKRDESDTE